jgi:hypothetical protein
LINKCTKTFQYSILLKDLNLYRKSCMINSCLEDKYPDGGNIILVCPSMRTCNSYKISNAFTMRNYLALAFIIVSAILLALSFISFGLAWYHGIQDGMIPSPWGTYEGNHGPWRHYFPGRGLIYFTIVLQCKSFLCALISLLLRRLRIGVWLVFISFLVFLIVLWTHYWLID